MGLRMIVDKRLHSLFQDLRQLRFHSTDKPSRTENLTDILEIVAVMAGLKPAHLSGQGFRSGALIDALERMAARHGLLSLRTKEIKPYRHRRPRYDPAIYRWETDSEERRRQAGVDVLWIYREASLNRTTRSWYIYRSLRGAARRSHLGRALAEMASPRSQ